MFIFNFSFFLAVGIIRLGVWGENDAVSRLHADWWWMSDVDMDGNQGAGVVQILHFFYHSTGAMPSMYTQNKNKRK